MQFKDKLGILLKQSGSLPSGLIYALDKKQEEIDDWLNGLAFPSEEDYKALTALFGIPFSELKSSEPFSKKALRKVKKRYLGMALTHKSLFIKKKIVPLAIILPLCIIASLFIVLFHNLYPEAFPNEPYVFALLVPFAIGVIALVFVLATKISLYEHNGHDYLTYAGAGHHYIVIDGIVAAHEKRYWGLSVLELACYLDELPVTLFVSPQNLIILTVGGEIVSPKKTL